MDVDKEIEPITAVLYHVLYQKNLYRIPNPNTTMTSKKSCDFHIGSTVKPSSLNQVLGFSHFPSSCAGNGFPNRVTGNTLSSLSTVNQINVSKLAHL